MSGLYGNDLRMSPLPDLRALQAAVLKVCREDLMLWDSSGREILKLRPISLVLSYEAVSSSTRVANFRTFAMLNMPC